MWFNNNQPVNGSKLKPQLDIGETTEMNYDRTSKLIKNSAYGKVSEDKPKYYTDRTINLSINVFEKEIKDTKKADRKLIRIWTPEYTLMFVVNASAIKPYGKVFQVSLNNLYPVFSAMVASDGEDKPNFREVELIDLIKALDNMGLLKRKLREAK